MNSNESSGLWPVMLTPFTDEGNIDYASLERLIDWYERNGATGLFAVCQSSETFYLSLRERVELVAIRACRSSPPATSPRTPTVRRRSCALSGRPARTR